MVKIGCTSKNGTNCYAISHYLQVLQVPSMCLQNDPRCSQELQKEISGELLSNLEHQGREEFVDVNQSKMSSEIQGNSMTPADSENPQPRDVEKLSDEIDDFHGDSAVPHTNEVIAKGSPGNDSIEVSDVDKTTPAETGDRKCDINDVIASDCPCTKLGMDKESDVASHSDYNQSMVEVDTTSAIELNDENEEINATTKPHVEVLTVTVGLRKDFVNDEFDMNYPESDHSHFSTESKNHRKNSLDDGMQISNPLAEENSKQGPEITEPPAVDIGTRQSQGHTLVIEGLKCEEPGSTLHDHVQNSAPGSNVESKRSDQLVQDNAEIAKDSSEEASFGERGLTEGMDEAEQMNLVENPEVGTSDDTESPDCESSRSEDSINAALNNSERSIGSSSSNDSSETELLDDEIVATKDEPNLIVEKQNDDQLNELSPAPENVNEVESVAESSEFSVGDQNRSEKGSCAALVSSKARRSSSKGGSGQTSTEKPRAKRKYKEKRRNLTPMSRIEELSASNDESSIKSPVPHIEVLPVMPRKLIVSYLPGVRGCEFAKPVNLPTVCSADYLNMKRVEVHEVHEASPAAKLNTEDSLNKYTMFAKPNEDDIFPKLHMLKKSGDLPTLKDHPSTLDESVPSAEGIHGETINAPLASTVETKFSHDKTVPKTKNSKTLSGIYPEDGETFLPTNDAKNSGSNDDNDPPVLESSDSLNVSDYRIHLSSLESLDSDVVQFDPVEASVLDGSLQDFGMNWSNLQSLASISSQGNDELFQVSYDEIQYPTESSPISGDEKRPKPSFDSIKPINAEFLEQGRGFNWSNIIEPKNQNWTPSVIGDIVVMEVFVRNFVISPPLKPRIASDSLKRIANQQLMSAAPLKAVCCERIECNSDDQQFLMASAVATTVKRGPRRRQKKEPDYMEDLNSKIITTADPFCKETQATSSVISVSSNISTGRSSDLDLCFSNESSSDNCNNQNLSTHSNECNQSSPENSNSSNKYLQPASFTSDESIKLRQDARKRGSSSSKNQMSSSYNSKSKESGYYSVEKYQTDKNIETAGQFANPPNNIEEHGGIFIDDEIYSTPPRVSFWQDDLRSRYNRQRDAWICDSNLTATSHVVIAPEQPSVLTRVETRTEQVCRRLLKFFLVFFMVFLLFYFLWFLVTNDYFFDYTCWSREFLTTKSTGMNPH